MKSSRVRLDRKYFPVVINLPFQHYLINIILFHSQHMQIPQNV